MRKVKFKVVDVYRGKRCSIYARGNYRLIYSKGRVVRARKGTLGVAVFETRYQAENFCNSDPHNIIRVVPIGRGRTVDTISRDLDPSSFNDFYVCMKKGYYTFDVETMKPPSGTVFYPAVKVLE